MNYLRFLFLSLSLLSSSKIDEVGPLFLRVRGVSVESCVSPNLLNSKTRSKRKPRPEEVENVCLSGRR